MTNPTKGNDSPAATFIVAAILVIIVLAAVNTQSIMHGIGIGIGIGLF